jgi:hypothetical protein
LLKQKYSTMNLTNNLKITALICGLLVGTALTATSSVVIGPPPTGYTYLFNPIDGGDWAVGSTITIQDSGGSYSVVGWDLLDSDPFNLTPGNSFLSGSDILSADGTGWSGSFDVQDASGDSFSSTTGTDISAYDAGNGNSDLGFGSWTPLNASVPDAGVTAAFLGMSFVGLSWMRRKMN